MKYDSKITISYPDLSENQWLIESHDDTMKIFDFIHSLMFRKVNRIDDTVVPAEPQPHRYLRDDSSSIWRTMKEWQQLERGNP